MPLNKNRTQKPTPEQREALVKKLSLGRSDDPDVLRDMLRLHLCYSGVTQYVGLSVNEQQQRIEFGTPILDRRHSMQRHWHRTHMTYADMIRQAHHNGVASALDAYFAGVPIEDLLA